MKGEHDERNYTTEDYDRLVEALPFLLGGLSGRTNGNEIVSITLQRADLHAFRVVLRGSQRTDEGGSVRVVSFSNSEDPGECLLLAEGGYRDATARWHVDKYAKSSSPSDKPSVGPAQLVLLD